MDCERCSAFDHDYGSCTIPSTDLSFACPNEQVWYFTFGCGDELHASKYVRIKGDYESARQEMVRRYGLKWAFQYDEHTFIKNQQKLKKCGLGETPLTSEDDYHNYI